MRLFVALGLPGSERARVMAASAALRAAPLPVRWVEEDALHVTLRFLGEVAEPVASALARAVTGVARRHAAFPVELHGAGAFPNAMRPTVWWVGVERSPALDALRDDLEAAVIGLGFPAETRPFIPHLTLGRTRRGAVVAGSADGLLRDVAVHSTFTVDTLDLMRSQLSTRGARYERLLAAELAS